MKSVTILFITFSALFSFAQTKVCTDAQIQKEGRDYLAAQDIYHVEFIQDCLKLAVDKEARISPKSADRPMRLRVLAVLAEIKHSEMAGLVKCETTNTPGCLSDEKNSVFTPEEEKMLDHDADLKREAVRKANEEGLGVED